MIRVLFHFAGGPRLRTRLAPLLQGLDVRWCAEDDEDRFRKLLAGTDVLWHVLRPITAEDMDAAPGLRLIHKLGTGVNTIDLDAARQRGIAVANMPGANAQAVAEATLALMLATIRRLVALDRTTRRGKGWPIDTALAERVGEIGGRTVGIVGYGTIGRQVATVLAALGADVVHTSRRPTGDPARRSLPELLQQADIVSLHLPLTADTERLIGPAELELLPPGAILVNTSRGQIVDETALVNALLRGRLAGAGLDVFEHEPLTESPLFSLDNVVVQPHVAWLTAETLERCVRIGVENCRRLAAGDSLLHVVFR